jgi:hypothetical protein
MIEFQQWLNELNEITRTLPYSNLPDTAPLIDAAIPYSLGMTPLQAARGLFYIDRRAYDTIKQASEERRGIA